MIEKIIVGFIITGGVGMFMFSIDSLVRLTVEVYWKNEEMKQIPVIKLRERKERGYIDLS